MLVSMNRQVLLRALGYGLVLAGVVVAAAALAGPWSWRLGSAHARPEPGVLLAVAALGPLLSVVRLAAVAVRPPPVPPTLSAGLAGAAAASAAAITAGAGAGVSSLDGLAPGAPLATAGCLAAAVGWLIVAVTGGAPVPVPAPAAAAAAAAVLVVSGTGYALVHWRAETRYVDHRTAAAAASQPPALPVDPGRPRWRSAQGGVAVGVAGRALVLRDKAGVRVLDVTTGAERWRYLRRDVSVDAVGLAADGRTVVGLWRGHDGALAVGFDSDTGVRRWQRRYTGRGFQDASASLPARLADRIVGAGDVAVKVPFERGADLVALDVRTGARRWTYLAAGCVLTDLLGGASDLLAVAAFCRRSGELRPVVLGLSTVDGAVRWEWSPPQDVARFSDELALAATTGGVLVQYGALRGADSDDVPLTQRAPRTGTVLSAQGGTAGATHRVPAPFATATGTTAVYVGDRTTAVDLAFGRPLWTAQAPGPGWTPVAAVAVGPAVLVALRGGPGLRLLGFQPGDPAPVVDAVVSDEGCAECVVRLFAGPALVVVALGDRVVAVG
jgi:hypothetical protein